MKIKKITKQVIHFMKIKVRKMHWIKDINNDQILKSLPLISGNREIIKKTTKKTIPKLLLELILISSI